MGGNLMLPREDMSSIYLEYQVYLVENLNEILALQLCPELQTPHTPDIIKVQAF